MKNFFSLFLVAGICLVPAWAADIPYPKHDFRPSVALLKDAADLVPEKDRRDVLAALRTSGQNGWELMHALRDCPASQREAMAFLIANMPGRDLVALTGDFLLKDVRLSFEAVSQVPWGSKIPREIFLNDVVPYASVNERRDDWRVDFFERFIPTARQFGTIDSTVLALNKEMFAAFHVAYSATKRPKPDQSPYETIAAHYASCTGLSILLVDALRAAGVPARIAGIAMWPDGSGNHTWVEIWDGAWHHVGAAEPGELDHAWFEGKAASAGSRHPIYAVSFKKTGKSFPMPWAPRLHFVSAIDVTQAYVTKRWHPGDRVL